MDPERPKPRRKPLRQPLYDSPVYLELVERIGKNVKRIRLEKGLRQDECAHQCNKMTPAMLWTIEAGKTNITAATLARLAEGLGVDAGEFFAKG